MKSFGLVFVLYQPTGDFLGNLSKAQAACANVVAVDNSPEADARLHQHLREQGIENLLIVPLGKKIRDRLRHHLADTLDIVDFCPRLGALRRCLRGLAQRLKRMEMAGEAARIGFAVQRAALER